MLLQASAATNDWLLSLFVFAPMVGMLVLLVLPKERPDIVKTVAAAFAAVPLVIGFAVFCVFRDTGEMQYVYRIPWIDVFDIHIEYYVGIDGISAPMIVLSGLIGFIAIIASWGINKQEKGYFALLLLLLSGMNGVFVSLDFFLFYVFWELMLLPMYFLIGVWGGPKRVYAAIKFFLYTMAGSVLMLVVMIALYYGSAMNGDGRSMNEVGAGNNAFRLATSSSDSENIRLRYAGAMTDLRANPSRYEQEVSYIIQGGGEVLGIGAAVRRDIAAQLSAYRKERSLYRSTTAGIKKTSILKISRKNKAVRMYEQMYQYTLNELIKVRSDELSRGEPRAPLRGTFSLPELKMRWRNFEHTFALFGYMPSFAVVMFLFLFIGFAIKVPIFPFHTWLPWAHVQAPTAVSVILAGVLLKMGLYGFLRIAYPIFPMQAVAFAVPIGILGVINILYGGLCAMAQTDMKKLVAYSSVSHMGFCMLGLASLTTFGMSGAILQMFNHGTSAAMMFLLVGVVYDRAHHRDIEGFGGLAKVTPVFAGIMMIGLFASMGLPGLSGFVSEAMVLLGSFSSDIGMSSQGVLNCSFQSLTILAALGVIITAGYLLWMYQRIFFGPLNPKYTELPDMTPREHFTLVPLVVVVIIFGVYPQPLIDLCQVSSNALQEFIISAGGHIDQVSPF